MLIEEVNQLLDPGFQPVETGFFRLPNGHMHVRVLTRMPRCSGQMVDWWFGYLDSTEKYKMWEPKSHLSCLPTENKKPGMYVGTGHLVEEQMGPEVLKVMINFHDPAEIFDTSRFAEANVGAVTFGRASDPEGNPHGMVVHFVQDTDFGCIMRSRFWLFEVPDFAGLGLMMHCMEEMGHLADFLPDLYARETAGN